MKAPLPLNRDHDADMAGNVLHDAKSIADSLPDLMVEARTIANSVMAGWHGRRRSGLGETFWQFRPFSPGEPAKRIDWRRSARDDHLYVREKEWEAAHTVWLWADLSPSMEFRSRLAAASKRDRALVLMLAVAELLARGGERIAIPGLTRPTTSRTAAERLATALFHDPPQTALPDITAMTRFSEVIVIGDLLDPIPAIDAFMAKVATAGANLHLVQILDPVEETFPFAGRTEFLDPESTSRLTAGRAENWAEAYTTRLDAHRRALSDRCRRTGLPLLVHHTDRPASEPLLQLYERLAGLSEAAPRLSVGDAAIALPEAS